MTGGDQPGSGDGLDPVELGLGAGIGFRLGRLVRCLRSEWAAELARLELSPPQAAVLSALTERPGCSLRGLARVLGAEPMRIKRCVDELEQRGLLASAHHGGERRSRALELTPAGKSLSRRAGELARAQEQRFRAVLGPERRAGLDGAFSVLERALGLGPGETTPGAERRGDRARPAPGPSAHHPTSTTKEQQR